MIAEKTYTNCKHWTHASCPQKNNEIMAKTKAKDLAALQYVSSYDLEAINKLCSECAEFKIKD